MKLSALLIALALTLSSVAADAPPGFEQGNRLYAEQKFAEAIAAYQEAVQSVNWSSALFYNLGNAYYRAGDFGRAILSYERALALAPDHPEAEANLQVARDKVRAHELPQTRLERWFDIASIGQYAWFGTLAFWLAAFLLVNLIFRRRRSSVLLFGTSAALLAALFSAAAVWQLSHGRKGGDVGIVTEKTIARVATADTANSVLALPPGSEVRIREVRGAWTYVLLPNDQRGWVPSPAVERVRL